MRDSKRDTDVKNRLLDSVGEGEGGMIWENSTETCIFHIHMWNRSPVQCQRMRQGAQGWCTGVTLRDGMWREVGRGFRMGNPCTPMADSCQWWQKPLQYCKVISLQLNIFLKKSQYYRKQKNPVGWRLVGLTLRSLLALMRPGLVGWWRLNLPGRGLREQVEMKQRFWKKLSSEAELCIQNSLATKQHPNQKQWDAQCKETRSLRDGTGQGGSALGRSRPAVFQRQCIPCLWRPQTCQPQLFSALAQLMLCRGGRKSFSALSRSLLLHSKIQLKKMSKRRKTYTIYQIFMHKEHLSRMKIKKIKKKRNNEH